MFDFLKQWFEKRRIQNLGLTSDQWESAIADWPVIERYHGAERDSLRRMSFRLLVNKHFIAGGDFELTVDICLKVATMACVPVLHLGLDWYDHWHSFIIYEDDFIPNRPYRSGDGIVHPKGIGLSGEAWFQGPVILSWKSICESGAHARTSKASNVVIHEVAHKLDMLRDGANGSPPMHPNMRPGEWHNVFTAAWDRLQKEFHSQHTLPINAYALTSPAEFFAVCSESFFEDPENMLTSLPNIYRLLCQFYRQAPLQ